MKKTLLSFAAVVTIALTVVSCTKNNVPSVPPTQDPSLEKDTIDAFIASHAYSMVELTDTSTIVSYDGYSTLYKEKILTPGLMYQIVTPGDLSAGSVEMLDTEIGGSKTGNTLVYNTVSDSTQIVSVNYKASLLNGVVFDSTKAGTPATLLALFRTIPAWKATIGKIGKGGHIRIVTPSAYAYGGQSSTAIPKNSPLFFDVYLVGTVSNTYSVN